MKIDRIVIRLDGYALFLADSLISICMFEACNWRLLTGPVSRLNLKCVGYKFTKNLRELKHDAVSQLTFGSPDHWRPSADALTHELLDCPF